MEKRAIKTDQAPAAIGAYSQAVTANGFVFVSGQIGLDPSSGRLVGEDVVQQTEQVLKNLTAVLSAAGSDLGKVVKATVYLTDIADFKEVNQVYARHFANLAPPARAAVQVCALPLNARVEIEAVALC